MPDEMVRVTTSRCCPRSIGFIGVLFLGIALGVGADRLYLSLTGNKSAGEITPDSRLLGLWIPDDKTAGSLEFRDDGTYTGHKVISINGEIDSSEPVTGQYRWIAAERIEMFDPAIMNAWIPMKVVIDEKRLTLLSDDARVARYARSQ